jgi:hypothetical protein
VLSAVVVHLALPLPAEAHFTLTGNYATDTYPTDVEVADLDRDGKLDLVVATGWNPDFTSSVSVLLGQGDGTFAPRVDYETVTESFSMVVGDLDDDGDADVAVTNFGRYPDYAGFVSVLLGNGDGTLAPRVDYAMTAPRSLAIGEVDGNNAPDLVVAHGQSSDGKLSVLSGNGDGTFAPGADLDAGLTPVAVAIEDLNGDTEPDIAAALLGTEKSVAVFLADGSGSFNAPVLYETGVYPGEIAIADLDGDAVPDLTVLDEGSGNQGNVSVLLGHGDGTFAARVNSPVGLPRPRSLRVGNLTGDPVPDVTFATASSVAVMVGRGDGAFSQPLTYPVGWFPRAAAVADFDGDTNPDLAVANNYSHTVSVLLFDPAPEVVGAPPRAARDEPYRFVFGLAGKPTPTVTVTGGALPPGLELSADGVLSGTPIREGSFTATVTATNGVGTGATITFTVLVNGVTIEPRAGPGGTKVVITGGGFEPGDPVIVKYRTSQMPPPMGPSKILCIVAIAPDGGFRCEGKIPIGRRRGDLGPHDIVAAEFTPRLKARTTFTLTE